MASTTPALVPTYTPALLPLLVPAFCEPVPVMVMLPVLAAAATKTLAPLVTTTPPALLRPLAKPVMSILPLPKDCTSALADELPDTTMPELFWLPLPPVPRTVMLPLLTCTVE